ncbi:MAG: DUF962 domain-containing protein [Gammaproteobacteria bacterium]|nr:DUF962 domain-containing protein [Gammaproteobacteria bacterium]
MKSISQWLSEYGESHTNKTNKIIHYICVPVIYMTVFGLLWSVPFPVEDAPIWLNWSTLLAMPVMVFYFMLSIKVGLGMLLFSAAVVAFLSWWQVSMAMSVLTMSVIAFILAWIMQFVGHHVEGKKPSFFKDVQFLLIGPAWILCHAYSKANIRY